MANPSEAPNPRLSLAWGKTRLAILIGGLSALAGAAYIALYLILLQTDATSLATAPALAAMLVPLACALPALATLFSYRRFSWKDYNLSESKSKGWLAWLNRLAAAVITAALAGWAIWFSCVLLVPLLPGAQVAVPALIAVSALCSGLSGAVTSYSSASMDQHSLLTRLGAMIGLGLLLSMQLVADPAWWRDSLSYMGRSGPAGLVFTTTMVLGGLGLCGAMLEIGRGLVRLELFPPRAARILTWLLALGSLGLVGTGLFPSSTEPVSLALHKLSSNGGLVIFVGVMLALRWLAPPFGRTAHRASALMGALIIGAFFLHVFNILNFVWYELIYIALLMTWLFFFESYSRVVLGDLRAGQ